MAYWFIQIQRRGTVCVIRCPKPRDKRRQMEKGAIGQGEYARMRI